MKGFALGLSLSLAFILGCVSAPVLIPRLSAQNPVEVTRWEYLCDNSFRAVDDMSAFLARSGAEGWELVTQGGNLLCLKRPLR
ncbi:MAG: hypothetical protein H6722_13690 [Sandaracinus sp.]|nr:hypothetical protein [Sandaracinus sp.]MCB9613497.1 hypothetical protein [Sandaracinus sp.]